MRWLFVVALVALAPVASVAKPTPPRWQTLPLPPAPPAPDASGYVPIEGAKIYWASYGKGDPVILLHGGLGNGGHFAHQIPPLAKRFRVIAIDSRGQGRSTLPKGKLSYHAMAGDVVAVMDALELERAAFVGWSDGGAIALDLAIHHAARVSKIFVFGTNYDASGHKRSKTPSKTFPAYMAKCKADYKRLGNAKSYAPALAALLPVWKSSGGFTKDQLRSIKAPATIALGEHDEIVHMDHVEDMAKLIPNANLVVFDDASHFALWQDPDAFTKAVLAFLGVESP